MKPNRTIAAYERGDAALERHIGAECERERATWADVGIADPVSDTAAERVERVRQRAQTAPDTPTPDPRTYTDGRGRKWEITAHVGHGERARSMSSGDTDGRYIEAEAARRNQRNREARKRRKGNRK